MSTFSCPDCGREFRYGNRQTHESRANWRRYILRKHRCEPEVSSREAQQASEELHRTFKRPVAKHDEAGMVRLGHGLVVYVAPRDRVMRLREPPDPWDHYREEEEPKPAPVRSQDGSGAHRAVPASHRGVEQLD